MISEKSQFIYNFNKLIVFEGLDGCGKTVQMDMLKSYIYRNFHNLNIISLPSRAITEKGAIIGKYLRGNLGAHMDLKTVAQIFANYRKEMTPFMQAALTKGACVLADRYVPSNIAYQCAKLMDDSKSEKLKKWIEWHEYTVNKIPKPDIVIYLDVPLSFVESILHGRGTLKRGKMPPEVVDIHEQSMTLQKAVKRQYELLFKSDPTFLKIECTDEEGNMKSEEAIHEDIVELIKIFFTEAIPCQ